MTQEIKTAEFVEFEILRGSEQALRQVSPWQMFRLLVKGLTGLALFFVILAFGVFFMIPLLIFFLIARIISTLLPAGTRA